MKLSARSEYGVRVLVNLARHYGNGPLSLTDIAAHEELPLAYLEQIMADLRQGGLVLARRGRYGGYTLARPPAEITMSEVVRLLEGSLAPIACVPDEPNGVSAILCARQDYCTTRVLWIRVRDGIVEALASTTLADLVPDASVPLRQAAMGAMPFVEAGTGSLFQCPDLLPVERTASTESSRITSLGRKD